MVTREGGGKNPYVQSLVSGLINCGHEVVYSLDDFWYSYFQYDLLYFQWPEAIFDWRRSSFDIKKLSLHFDRIKETHVKTLITCHNLHPHNNDVLTTDLYNLVYSRVDFFHHMGKFSYELMKEKYPNKYHFIAPHHIADVLWGSPLNSSDAKRRLHISEKDIVISSFGAFRNEEETQLYVNMAKDVTSRNLSFLAPRIPIGHFYKGRHLNRTIKYLFDNLLYKKLGIKYSGFLTNEDLHVWLYASDIVFIQRKEILNSGNLPLAYSAGKIVVGPDLGNVGEILKGTNNYVFNPNNRASVKQAVLDAIKEVKTFNQLGSQNLRYAQENWRTSRVCRLIDKELTRIVN